MDGDETGDGGVTRRGAMGGTAGLTAALLLADADAATAQVRAEPLVPNGALDIRPVVNGQPMAARIDPRMSLLDLLRERFELTGAKKGCDHGQCGACTVHVDGRRVVSCLTLAAKVDGREVTTIEGLSTRGTDGGERLHPMQQAFIDHDALQCGYCTPGQIMAAVACVREGNTRNRAEIRDYMSGNICRCGAYVGIVAAIEEVAAKGGRV